MQPTPDPPRRPSHLFTSGSNRNLTSCGRRSDGCANFGKSRNVSGESNRSSEGLLGGTDLVLVQGLPPAPPPLSILLHPFLHRAILRILPRVRRPSPRAVPIVAILIFFLLLGRRPSILQHLPILFLTTNRLSTYHRLQTSLAGHRDGSFVHFASPELSHRSPTSPTIKSFVLPTMFPPPPPSESHWRRRNRPRHVRRPSFGTGSAPPRPR